MTTYLVFAILWTLYMAFETYVFSRPQSRPYFVGFLITHMLLAPLSFVMSLTSGVLRERIEAAYGEARRSKEAFRRSGRKKLIG
jgi:uncharacterized membrane protein YozB (DUF420 family)